MEGEDTSMIKAKKWLRERNQALLRGMTDARRAEGSTKIAEAVYLIATAWRASGVMSFLNMRSEPDMTLLHNPWMAAERPLMAPRVVAGSGIAPVLLKRKDASFSLDASGVRAPDGATVATEAVDLVVVPGLAFDPMGHRLGRGGGHYDQFLPRLRRQVVTVGVSFDEQVVDLVPTDPHDWQLQYVVTPTRIWWFGRLQARTSSLSM
ncbi:MAG: 5-formyltetrahydrofolate cyclo-ligase [Planctomycetes bacterium]|nr:5-formyltetrahydrofolate cyclo-ligase [Planctomycetota bacterium]